jgi:hypothetical protein
MPDPDATFSPQDMAVKAMDNAVSCLKSWRASLLSPPDQGPIGLDGLADITRLLQALRSLLAGPALDTSGDDVHAVRHHVLELATEVERLSQGL